MKIFISCLFVALIIISSACVTMTGTDVTSIAKSLPAVREFLREYPNARITVAYWDNETVTQYIDSIRADCGEQMRITDYYRVNVSDPSLSLIMWLSKNNYEVMCAIRQASGEAETTEKGEIIDVEERGVKLPLPEKYYEEKYYCGNGRCDEDENSVSCPMDCLIGEASCGNNRCEPGELVHDCPQDCAYEIYPYEADVKSCSDKNGREIASIGREYANWFVEGRCGNSKLYNVNPGQTMILYVYTDDCAECKCNHPDFYIFEYDGSQWLKKDYFDLPDEKGISKLIQYTPKYAKIKIHSNSCFFIRMYSPSPVVPVPEIHCKDSDGGKDYYTRGTVVEYYQNSAGATMQTETISVAIPVQVNAIVQAETTDSQASATGSIISTPQMQTNSQDIAITSVSSMTSATDFCIDDATLQEFYCESGKMQRITYKCPYGCLDGACTKTECKYLYWFDNNHMSCSYDRFCGAYMYSGLRVFENKDECYAALNPIIGTTTTTTTSTTSTLNTIITTTTYSTTITINVSDCSNYIDSICPVWCSAGSDIDCCLNEGYHWLNTSWGGGCYPTDYNPGCSPGQPCSDYQDGCCPNWCSAGADADCCNQSGYCWIPTPWGHGCYPCETNNTTTSTTQVATTTTILEDWFCNDTDNFYSYSNDYHIQRLATKGVCADNSGTYEDYCIDANALVDYYCGPLLQDPKSCLGSTTYSCTGNGFAGCQNGACVYNMT